MGEKEKSRGERRDLVVGQPFSLLVVYEAFWGKEGERFKRGEKAPDVCLVFRHAGAELRRGRGRKLPVRGWLFVLLALFRRTGGEREGGGPAKEGGGGGGADRRWVLAVGVAVVITTLATMRGHDDKEKEEKTMRGEQKGEGGGEVEPVFVGLTSLFSPHFWLVGNECERRGGRGRGGGKKHRMEKGRKGKKRTVADSSLSTRSNVRLTRKKNSRKGGGGKGEEGGRNVTAARLHPSLIRYSCCPIREKKT